MNARNRVGSRRVLTVVLAVGVVACAGLGLTAALGTQILHGANESGQGSEVTQHSVVYWSWDATVITVIPNRAPALVSHVVAAPTRLPRFVGTSYAINTPTVGQTAVAWTFTEATTAPRSVEFVITFVDGLAGPVSTIDAYLETSARAPLAALNFVFYWDAGAAAATGLAISTMTVTVQACTAIGVCP
jgi:hypothetical protein